MTRELTLFLTGVAGDQSGFLEDLASLAVLTRERARDRVADGAGLTGETAADDVDADVRVTNEILDWIERRIGDRPDQYVLSFGAERRWSPVARCWLDADPLGASNDTAPLWAQASRTVKSVR